MARATPGSEADGTRRSVDVASDEQNDRQVLAPGNGLGHEWLCGLAGLNEEHAGDGDKADRPRGGLQTAVLSEDVSSATADWC